MLNSNFLFSSVHSINSYSYLSLHDALPILFFTEVRYGGLAITYNISASLFGGTTPLLISWLINITANKLMPAYYIIFASLIGIVVVTLFLRNTSGKPLRGSPPAVTEKHEISEDRKSTRLNSSHVAISYAVF